MDLCFCGGMSHTQQNVHLFRLIHREFLFDIDDSRIYANITYFSNDTIATVLHQEDPKPY